MSWVSRQLGPQAGQVQAARRHLTGGQGVPGVPAGKMEPRTMLFTWARRAGIPHIPYASSCRSAHNPSNDLKLIKTPP